MEYSSEERACIWLDSFPLDKGAERRLLEGAGSAAALVRRFPEFREIVVKSAGESVYNNMLASLSDGGEYFRKTAAELEGEGIRAVTRASRDYPETLKKYPDSPPVLYAKGNVSLLGSRLFTVVGSRRTPPAALRLCERVCEELSSGFTLLSGTAEGGDSSALCGALRGSGRVIAVPAGGFSHLPSGNAELLRRVAERGLLLSAHTFRESVRPFSYAERNKLLARLGEGTLVVGAGEKSGTLMTAEYAFRENRPVFAFPYFPGSDVGAGCNALLKKGGILTENSVDICGRFGIDLSRERERTSLTEPEAAVMKALRGLSEAHVSEIAAASGIPVFRLYGILAALETKGLAVRLGGNRFSPV